MSFEPSDLRAALERDELFPAFQPVIEMRTGQLMGFEALARWIHPVLGNIPPDQFIPVAESEGLIGPLTEIIVRKTFACEALARSSYSVAVNISPQQLLDAGLPRMLACLAEKAGFPLQRLIVELTENMLLDDVQGTKGVPAELKALGCRLALDDFGTGYSSLRHLHALPIDVLKVDQSFVRTMTSARESRKIVASVIGLGQSLGLITAAEGVETREQAELLQWMGCDLGQGWLYGAAAPAARMAELVAQQQFPVAVSSRLSEAAMSLEGPPADRLAQLQAIYDGAPVGLCLLDRRLRYVSLNRQLAEFNRVPVLGHLGRTPREVVPQVYAQVESAIARALAGEPVTGVEIQKPPAAGAEAQTLMATYQPVRDEAGEVIGVSVAVMDVTERKRMEQVLRDVEAHHRSLVHLSPHVPWVLNARGEVTEASPRWERITGQPLEQALGNGWLKVLHPEDVPPTREAIRLCLETGAPIDLRYRVRNGNGKWKWMRSRGAPRLTEGGEVMAVYGVVEEIEPAEVAGANYVI
ncbi:EAL domain-containing protein [Acidobacteria bacterium AB60]|nr:EAL domain-containing protein [Acidobacteria bacterium AB60]